MRWREAAETVLSDKQKQGMKKLLGGHKNSETKHDEYVHDAFHLETSLLIYPDLVSISKRIIISNNSFEHR